ncbi:MAG: alpha/beta hydrolase [Actinomycetota bacterium]|nr:alpha/beta hydrolase [Actinomycetota bacterium]
MPSITVDNRRTGYTDTGGAGTPVLLVHAFPLNARMWEPQIESLGDRWRLVAPDLMGFGASDAPEDPSAYSVDSFADDLKAVLDELGIDKVVLAGLSLGGYVALAFLRKHRSSVSALVLADTRSEADAPEAIEKRTNQQATVREQGPGALTDGLVGALLGEPTREKKPDVVATVRGLMENSPAGYIGALEAMKGRPDSTPDLAGITLPTLIIVGENDTLTPPELSRKMHEHIGGSRLVVIPEAGHLSNLEAPEAFNGALAEFLSTL